MRQFYLLTKTPRHKQHQIKQTNKEKKQTESIK